jgi:hypothetical protein
MTHFSDTGPDAPDAVRRRLVAHVALIGDEVHTRGPHGGSMASAVIRGRLERVVAETAAAREAAGIAAVAAAGRRAWDLHKATGETGS